MYIGRLDPVRYLLLGGAVGAFLGVSVLLSPWAPVALAGVMVGAAVLLRLPLRPIHLVYGLVFLTPFTAAMPRGQIVPFLTANDVLVILATAVGLVYTLMEKRNGLLPRPLMLALIAFVLGTCLGPVVLYEIRGDSLALDDMFSLVSPLKYLLVLWLFAIVPKTAAERAGLIRMMVLSAGAVAVIGLLQAANIAPVVDLINTVYPSEQTERSLDVGRVTSVLGAWNSLGLFLLSTLLIIAATIVDQTSARRRREWVVVAGIVLICLLATNLYSGILGAALGLVLIKTSDPRGLRSLVPLVLVALIGSVALLPTIINRAETQFVGDSWIPQTLRFRYEVWTRYFIPEIAQQPLLGVQPTFEEVEFPHPESQYIYYLYRSGILSLIGHVIWMIGTVVWLASARRREPPGPQRNVNRSLALVPIVLILVSSLIGLINPVFTYTASMTFFWMILGLVLNAQYQALGATTRASLQEPRVGAKEWPATTS